MGFKQVLIVQGWKSKPDDNWAPWLTDQLEAREVLVSVPSLSRADIPRPKDWIEAIKVFMLCGPDENTFFVTHSLGCMATLLYLEQLPEDIRVGGLVIVAGFCEHNASDRHERRESRAFFARPLDYEKIRRMVTKGIVAIQSTDDPFVPYEKHSKILEEKLGAKIITIEHGGHLNSRIGGYTMLPIALHELIKMGC